jgi:hypothetical protein
VTPEPTQFNGARQRGTELTRRSACVEEGTVDQLDKDVAVLHRLNRAGDLDQLASRDIGISEGVRLDVFRATALSSLSAPRMTIFNASSGNRR